MEEQSLSDKFAALVVVLLLILTAWGNAIALFVFAVLGLIVYSLLFRKSVGRGGSLAAIVGFVIAIIIAAVIWIW